MHNSERLWWSPSTLFSVFSLFIVGFVSSLSLCKDRQYILFQYKSYTNLYSMAGRRDIDRTYKCVSEWRFSLVKTCICSFILSCFWQPYECVTGISKVFWVVVSRYVCYSVCFSIFEKNSKVKFLIFFSSLWIVVGRCGIVVDRCGSLWVVVDRCGSLWVVPGFSDYAQVFTSTKQLKFWDSQLSK